MTEQEPTIPNDASSIELMPKLESVAERALDAAAEVHWDALDTGTPYSEVGALAKHNLKSILQPMIFAALRAAGIR